MYHVIRTRCSGQYVHYVAQGLLDLGNKIIASELLVAVPADLAGDKYLPSGCRNAVGIALGW
jgi:hypothetical protein